MVDVKVVAQRVRDGREEKKLRREDVASQAKVSKTTVDSLEQGRRLPRIETLDRIAEVLGVSVSDLLAAARQLQAA